MATTSVEALQYAMWEGLVRMTPPALCYTDSFYVAMETKNITLKAAVLEKSFKRPIISLPLFVFFFFFFTFDYVSKSF